MLYHWAGGSWASYVTWCLNCEVCSRSRRIPLISLKVRIIKNIYL